MKKISSGRVDGDYEALYQSYLAERRQVEHLSTLREIGLVISSTLDLNEALTLVANVVQGALDIRRLTIYTLDKKGDVFRPVIAKYGQDLITKERLEEDSVPARGSVLARSLDSRRVVMVNNSLQHAVYIPLVAKDTELGVMCLEDRLDGADFDSEDESLFQSLGAQVALTVNNAQLYAMAVTDGLTGLYVRRYFDIRMDEEFEQAKRYKRNFAMLMFDIDHFKKFNDTHGHQTGDNVLKQFADLLAENTRRSDVCCRYGGEEMTVILPETGIEEASQLAEKLRQLIEDKVFMGAEKQELHVTSSIGVAEFSDSFKGPGEIVKAADEALYRAKEGGRNRVEVA